jgi:ribonucleotide reductase beta subunit family protein with ferritin-like domain
MEFAALEGKTNFFEKRVAEYSKAGVATKNSVPDFLDVDTSADF